MDRSGAPAAATDDTRLRVLVADGDERVRSALRFLLGWTDETEVVAEVSAIERLLPEADLHRPDIVLLDWRIARAQPSGIILELRLALPSVLVVALGLTQDERDDALAAGAHAFVCKLDGPAALLAAIRALAHSSTQTPADLPPGPSPAG